MPATGCPYPKLEPHTWRNLLARATIFHAIRDQLGDLSDRALAVDAIDIAMRKINVHADEVSAAQPDACLAVVQTATAWIADLSEAARLRSIEADDAALLNRVVAQLAEVVTPASTAAPHPFAEVFTKVERRSASAYTKPHWRRPTLTLAKDSDPPRAHHFQRDPYAVSATTSPDGVVQLVLWPAGFSPATYAVLSSILVHEGICHGPARQDRDPRARRRRRGIPRRARARARGAGAGARTGPVLRAARRRLEAPRRHDRGPRPRRPGPRGGLPPSGRRGGARGRNGNGQLGGWVSLLTSRSAIGICSVWFGVWLRFGQHPRHTGLEL